jgi:hypothetical protein
MTETTHEFTPMDVNSQICKICGSTPGGKLHRRAAKVAEVKTQVPTPPASEKKP